MESLHEYLLAAVMVILLAYGLIKQIQQTITVKKSNKRMMYKYKRALIGNYVTSISFIGFSVSLMLNITNTLSQNATALTSFSFLAILLIAKFGVTPKQQDLLFSR